MWQTSANNSTPPRYSKNIPYSAIIRGRIVAQYSTRSRVEYLSFMCAKLRTAILLLLRVSFSSASKFQLDPLPNGLDIGSKCCYFGPRPRPCWPLYGQITQIIPNTITGKWNGCHFKKWGFKCQIVFKAFSGFYKMPALKFY